MSHPEMQYLKLVYEILKNGRGKGTRGIHGIKSIFGHQLKFDLRHGFPLLTTKKMPFKILLHELLWFISGDTNIKYLQDHKIHYWDDFADENGDLGPVYGYQWRKWPTYVPVIQNTDKGQMINDDNHGESLNFDHLTSVQQSQQGLQDNSVQQYRLEHIDQLQKVIDEIKYTPNSKTMMVSAHNPAQIDQMRLPPCHAFFQFNVTKGKLRLQLYQRSSDVFLGLPFNIAQYALLLLMVAKLTGYEARELIVSIGDAHLYNNHLEPAKEQLKRKPFAFPQVEISDVKTIDDFKEEHVKLINYTAHPHIKGDLVIL